MKRPDPHPEDDGRVVADMALLSGGDEGHGESGKGPRQPMPPAPPLSRRETRQIMVSATLAGLAVAGVLSLAVIGLVLFCQFVWFR